MKKLVTLLLAVALCLSLAVPASAATHSGTDGTITATIEGAISTETVTVKMWEYGSLMEKEITVAVIPDSGANAVISCAPEVPTYPGETVYEFIDGGYMGVGGGQVLDGPGSWSLSKSEWYEPGKLYSVYVNVELELFYRYQDTTLETVAAAPAKPIEPDLSALGSSVKSVTDGEFTLYVDNVIATETKTVTLFDAENVGKPEAKTIQVFRIGAATANVALFDPNCGGPTMGHDVYALNNGVYEGGPSGQLWGEGGFSADYATGWQKVDPKHLDGELIAVYCPGTTVGVYLAFEDVVEAASAKPAEPANPFVDVPADAYYHDAVLWALENGVTTGVTADTFAPTATCTRGQVVTFLWRASGKPEPKTTVNPFTDVSETSAFYKAILWAYESGITTGATDTTFNPSGTCTSGHVVTFLWRANGKPAASGDSALAAANAGRYFTDALAWADSADLIAGTGSAFVPANNSPRADIVTYLYRNAQ